LGLFVSAQKKPSIAETREFFWRRERPISAVSFLSPCGHSSLNSSVRCCCAQIEEQNMSRSRSLVVASLIVSTLVAGCGKHSHESQTYSAKRSPTTSPASAATPKLTLIPTPNPAGPVEAEHALVDESRLFKTETYDAIAENPFLAARQNPLSTFSIDVDTASYSIVRRFLKEGQLPPHGAVRIEELVNYFPYQYPQPKGDVPFSVNVELADCPWNAIHRLARIGLKGREVHVKERPASNLVFLLDVSGSMSDENKLPLVKSAMKLLVERLGATDRVAIVVYAGASGIVLPSTSADHRATINAAIDGLSADGSTNGGEGIRLAYRVATENFIKGRVNRVILCTDGDFNVGVTDQSELLRLIEKQAQSGVFLSVLGFGMGNYKDSTMEKLADKGNGNYAYIDTLKEARKVLVDQLSGTLVTIAKDVKIQIDFNPGRAAGYRLIGYENRLLRAEDFKDDSKDAGEIGAGHTVTAFYEIVPAGQPLPGTAVDPSKYQSSAGLADAALGAELFTVRLRYKDPEGQTSKPLDVPVLDAKRPFNSASDDYKFAASVAQFGMLLRDSKFRGNTNFDGVLEIASASLGSDRAGYRAEFLELVKAARSLKQPAGENPDSALRSETGPHPENLNGQPDARTQATAPRAAGISGAASEEANESPGGPSLVHFLLLAVLALLLFCPDKS
jgi:Ca-activated chloride channel homolog